MSQSGRAGSFQTSLAAEQRIVLNQHQIWQSIGLTRPVLMERMESREQ